VTGAQGRPNGSPRRKQTARIPTFKLENPPGSVPRNWAWLVTRRPPRVESYMGVDVATRDERLENLWEARN